MEKWFQIFKCIISYSSTKFLISPLHKFTIQLTVFKSPVISLIENASITMLTCIILNLNSTGAVPFITLTWLYIFPHVSPCMLQHLHLDVCVLLSSNRAFMIKLLLLFSTIFGTVHSEIHPQLWHSVAIYDVFCCFSHSTRDIFDCCTEFRSNSSYWLALCNILLCIFKHLSMLQGDPLMHSATLWPSSKQKYNSWIFTVSHLCYLFIIFNMSHHYQTPCFFSKNFAVSQSSVCICPPTRSLICFLEPINCFMSHCLIFWLHYYLTLSVSTYGRFLFS